MLGTKKNYYAMVHMTKKRKFLDVLNIFRNMIFSLLLVLKETKLAVIKRTIPKLVCSRNEILDVNVYKFVASFLKHDSSIVDTLFTHPLIFIIYFLQFYFNVISSF